MLPLARPLPPLARPPGSYADYLLETVAKRELFQWLSLTPTKFWHALLFRDR